MRDFLTIGLILGIVIGVALVICYVEDRIRKGR